MSGAYPKGNYEIFAPQNAYGKYHKYASQIVAIVSIAYHKGNKGGIKSAKMYFTEEVDKAMGHPPYVKLGTSGSNVGIIPCTENDGEVYVVSRKKTGDEQTGMPFVNINAFAKFLDLEEGVYSAHKEPGGVIEFNRKSKPSRP